MNPPTQSQYRQILGLRFYVGGASEAVDLGSQPGLVVAPAAPLLLELTRDLDCRQSLLEADLTLTDSGLMVLLWNLLTRDRIPRLSGLEYLVLLLRRPDLRAPGVVWVMPSDNALELSKRWLAGQGFPVDKHHFYVAPWYCRGPVTDPALRELADRVSARHVIISLGGGTQERLGLFLKKSCQTRPAIHCVGAAIGFLSGEQAPIPLWADRWKIGWFIRCIYNPRRFVPRYWGAFCLVPLLWRYRSQLPPLRS